MVYKLVITERAEQLTDHWVYYLIFQLKNEQAAAHLPDAVSSVYERLEENLFQFPECRGLEGRYCKCDYRGTDFILIYSEESNHSEQVKSELALAEDCECKIFTFRISDEKINPSFTYSLKKLHWIDAINTPLQNSIKELRARVWMNLGRDEGAALIEELPKAQTS